MIDKEKEEKLEQPVELEEEQVEEVSGGKAKNIYTGGPGIKFE